MRNFIILTFFYGVSVFLVNLLYIDEYGNFLYLLLSFLGLVYNLCVFFFTDFISKDYKFLSAGFVGVTTTFLIFNGGLIPLMYVKDFNFIDANAFGKYLDYPMLIKFATVGAVGNIALWLGYTAKLGRYLFSFYYEGLNYKRLLHLDFGEFFPKALIVLGTFFNFVLFVNGAYGRAAAEASEYSGLVRYLIAYSSYVEKIALIGYFILALIYFKTGKHKVWFWITLLLQAVFALVSGARGPIIFLFILTLLPYYYVFKKISRKVILGGFATLIVAFTLASEIKVFTQKVDKTSTSVSEYAEAYMQFREQSSAQLSQQIYSSLYYSMMRRLNTVAQGSVAVFYKDTHGVDNTDPNFVNELVMAPVYVAIPRSSLGSAFPSWGQWYRLKVLKQRNDTYANNITFGSVGFFYLTGKWIFVVIGFFLYGVMLNFSNNILKLNSGISFLVYLAILSAIGYISASVPSAIVSFLRFVIFLPIFFYVIIKVSNKLRV